MLWVFADVCWCSWPAAMLQVLALGDWLDVLGLGAIVVVLEAVVSGPQPRV